MKQPNRVDFLPRGLSRQQAAYYVGISATFFDQLVGDGRMPGPKRINSRRIWDRHAIDLSFDELQDAHVDIGILLSKTSDMGAGPKSSPDLIAKIEGPTRFYRGWIMSEEEFRSTVLAKPMGKLERLALKALVQMGGEDFGTIRGAGGSTSENLEIRGFALNVYDGDRWRSWRVTDEGRSAAQALS